MPSQRSAARRGANAYRAHNHALSVSPLASARAVWEHRTTRMLDGGPPRAGPPRKQHSVDWRACICGAFAFTCVLRADGCGVGPGVEHDMQGGAGGGIWIARGR